MWSLSFHHNVISLLGYTKKPYSIITRLYDVDLSRLIHNLSLPFSIGTVVSVTKQICSALEACHSLRIIHCDVKPSNILVEVHEDELNCVLCDFGIARAGEREGKVYGHKLSYINGLSPRYTAPEVWVSWRAQRINDIPTAMKSDVYSFGMVIWEMLARKLPFEGTSLEEMEVIVKI
eukprot:Lithocolla_globosa_v1_NODE_8480_length_815_cov_5.605263.p1 type:complete len:177 gc:universal NODE_8480_length_815_cov_5.605263:647-117(-)